MRALIIRYAAYGDIIHMSWLPRVLKEKGYTTVDVETNYKGYQLLSYNPFIDNLKMFEPSKFPDLPLSYVVNKWDLMGKEYDKYINLFRSLEYGHIAMEDQSIYYMDDISRAKNGDINYYDAIAIAAGMPECIGSLNGEVYYKDSEYSMAKGYMDKYKDKFKVVLNPHGTGPHKILKHADKLIDLLQSEIPDIQIFTTGDDKDRCIKSDNIITWEQKIPFREALLRVRYADCVIGCESGMMCGANMWGTPTVQIMTAASLNCHTKYAKNDYSIQSPAYCSPCFKGPYSYRGCPKRDELPICVDVSAEIIMNQVREVYAKYKMSSM